MAIWKLAGMENIEKQPTVKWYICKWKRNKTDAQGVKEGVWGK